MRATNQASDMTRREGLDGELKGLAAKLANEKFTSRAPAHVVEEQRTRQVEAQAKADKLSAALERLKDLA